MWCVPQLGRAPSRRFGKTIVRKIDHSYTSFARTGTAMLQITLLRSEQSRTRTGLESGSKSYTPLNWRQSMQMDGADLSNERRCRKSLHFDPWAACADMAHISTSHSKGFLLDLSHNLKTSSSVDYEISLGPTR